MRDGNLLTADTALRCGSDPLRYKRHGPITRRPQRLSDPAHLVFPGDRIPTSATLIRREALLEAGMFRALDRAEDLDMWVRLLERGSASLSPRVGVIYHLHSEQLTTDSTAANDAHLEVSRRYSDRPWFSERLIERWRGLVIWDTTRHALRNRHYAEAARNLPRLLRSPQRIYGAMRFTVGRTRNFRANARIALDGQPSMAVLVREPGTRSRVLDEIGARPVVDLSESPRISAYARLLHRPTSYAVVDSMAGAGLLRLAGIRVRRPGRDDGR